MRLRVEGTTAKVSPTPLDCGSKLRDRVTVENRERFQQLQNLAQKYTFLRPEGIMSMDELNLDQAPRNINKEEFQLERVRLQALVATTDPGCKKKNSLGPALWVY
ncbi:uncharacterized protein TNCV_2007001 [Trichonephila clavipes]|nr:uncharacterized protein TNCV_2007001 [Trichonephila clavipes]